MTQQEKIIKFRKALHIFWIISLREKIEHGELDWVIGEFLKGNNLNLHADIFLIANDIIFMNALLDGTEPEKDVIDKFIKLKYPKSSKP